jgi:glycerol-3-phosphate dehydrogenase (NAD(P)+)
MQRIGIIGGGAWGTALAQALRRAGRDVILWAREAEVVAAINRDHANPLFLPGIPLDPGIAATASLAAAAQVDALLLVAPAQHLRKIAAALGTVAAPQLPLVICTKGLSGPSFAAEVARGLPTAVTLACSEAETGRALVAALGGRSFRPYLSADPIGAEIGGAVKNVLAIACGIIMGRGLGDNARAALITRGLAEMVRLALAKGGKPETLMGLSGLGDLTLTCTGMQSRNHSLGFALGEGVKLADILAGRRSVAEGVSSSAATAGLARRLGVEMPIVASVEAVLHHGADIGREIEGLLARPFRPEAVAG